MLESIRVLFIEDNPDEFQRIAAMLRQSAHKTIQPDHTTTVTDALSRVQQQTYDALLLSIDKPGHQAIDTLLRLKAEIPYLPVVVLGAEQADDFAVEIIKIGAQDYLAKDDLNSELLVRSIRYAIERGRVEQWLRRSQAEYRSLITNMLDISFMAVIIFDRDFHVVWCNPTTELYFGIERDRLLGLHKDDLIHTIKSCFERPDRYEHQLQRAYQAGLHLEHLECHVKPSQQIEERWLEYRSQPILDGLYAGGRIELYTDITFHKELEFAESEQRQLAEAFRDISHTLSSSLDLRDVLDHILTNLSRIVPHDLASIAVLEQDDVYIARKNGRWQKQFAEDERRVRQNYRRFFETMTRQTEALIINDLQTNAHAWSLHGEMHAYLGFPIRLQDEVIGFISLLSKQAGFFNLQHASRLGDFSKLAAVAIQNACLYEQASQVAALEERQRLARELHDSVSQTLFSCRVMSETALRRRHNDPEGTFELIEDINYLTKTALAEMRILLLELRPDVLAKISLRQLFEQYLQPIQSRREFDVTFQVSEEVRLPAEIQLNFYRIIQEALNNIDKHAQASHVEITVDDRPDEIVLVVSDDGSGFQMDAVGDTSLGLRIMRERADEIHASLSIESKTGQGTRITVRHHKEKEEEAV